LTFMLGRYLRAWATQRRRLPNLQKFTHLVKLCADFGHNTGPIVFGTSRSRSARVAIGHATKTGEAGGWLFVRMRMPQGLAAVRGAIRLPEIGFLFGPL